jgi:hypothetical protein
MQQQAPGAGLVPISRPVVMPAKSAGAGRNGKKK